MIKKIGLIIFLLICVAAAVLLWLFDIKVTSYEECKEKGGRVNTSIAPSYCTYKDQTFTDGNW